MRLTPYGTTRARSAWMDSFCVPPTLRIQQEGGIAMIYQEINCPGIADGPGEYFLLKDDVQQLGLVDYKAMHKECEKVFQAVGLTLTRGRLWEKLNTSQQQLVMSCQGRQGERPADHLGRIDIFHHQDGSRLYDGSGAQSPERRYHPPVHQS